MSKKLTVPVTVFDELIFAVRVSGDITGTLVEEITRDVVVSAGPPPPPPPPPPTTCGFPPPQPRATTTTDANASPVAIRKRLLALRSERISGAAMKLQLSATDAHRPDSRIQPAPRFFMIAIAVVVLEGPVTEIVNVEVPGTLLESPTEEGESAHVAPTKAGMAQLKFTLLVMLVAGVRVSTALPDCPATIVTRLGLGTTEKSGRITFTTLLRPWIPR
jgi:hypothetical protein